MLLDAHQEYNQSLGDDEGGRDDNWFDDVLTLSVSLQEQGGLLAKGSCSETQIIKVFIQEQQVCI